MNSLLTNNAAFGGNMIDHSPAPSEDSRFDHFRLEFQDGSENDHITEAVARAFKPHKMSIVGEDSELSATFRSLDLGSLQIFFLKYGAEVRVNPGELENFTLVQMPIRGKAFFNSGRDTVTGSSKVSAVLSPNEPLHFHFPSNVAQLIVKIEQRSIERACIEQADSLPCGGLRFHPTLDLDSTAGRAWSSGLSYILEGSLNFPELFLQRTYADRCERLLIDALIFAQPSNCRIHAVRQGHSKKIRPAYVKRAEEYIRHHLSDVMSVEEIARAVGVSSRALFYAFQQTYGKAPMAYVRELRLHAVHMELTTADPYTLRLTDLASRCGFSHYGHFSSHYKRRYGVRPRQTLDERMR